LAQAWAALLLVLTLRGDTKRLAKILLVEPFQISTAIPQPEENEFLKVISQRDNGEI